MTPSRRTVHCALLLLLIASAWGASTPAGAVIRNQARAIVDGVTYLSNEVDVTVRAVCLPVLTPNGTPSAPGQSTNIAAGGVAYFPYTLTNEGNSRFTFELSLEQARSDWAYESLTLYNDANGNGRLDVGEEPVVFGDENPDPIGSGEGEFDPGDSAVTLASGASATFVLEVAAPTNALGDGVFSPIAACSGPASPPTSDEAQTSRRVDAQNYARVRVVEGAALQLSKTASEQRLGPGDEVRFEMQMRNAGSKEAINPVLTDDFNLADLDGLTYIGGSASASRGTVEYSDGTSWTQTEPSTVRGVRVRLPTLEVGGEVRLGLRLRVETGATTGARQNLAVARAETGGPGDFAEVRADFRVDGTTPGGGSAQHFLGPRGNPRANPGGEGSADDTQSINRLVYRQTRCFAHTLENAGAVGDRYEITFSGVPTGVTASLQNDAGDTLPFTLELRAGERRDFRFCLSASRLVRPFTATLTATSLTTRQTNLTYDRVNEVVGAGPELDLVKSAEPEGTIGEGELLTYTLTVTNNHDFTLNDVRISDLLQGFERSDAQGAADVPAPTFVSASDGGVYDAQTRTVTWRAGRLEAGERVSFTLQVRMPEDVPDGTRSLLRNRFSVSARELLEPKPSNEVVHAFPLLSLNIEKTVQEEAVRIGDTLRYTVTVSNPNDVPLNLTLIDTPPERTAYVANSATVKSGANERKLEPERRGGELVWDLTNEPDFRIEPRGSADGRDQVSVSYTLTVQPGAQSPLQNTAYALGRFGDGSGAVSGVVVASDEVQVEVEIEDRLLGQPDALLSGRVYLDVNENYAYERGLDLPLPGARLLLPNGWQTLSDAEGRYTFRDLAPGAWSVTLDAASAPFAPLPHPEGLREGYQHRLVLQGLSVSDFPLVAPAGTIRAVRQTTLRFGPLSVEKRLIALPRPDGGEGVRVVLNLSSPEPLPDLTISDPVPGEEPRRYTFETFEGEQTLTYDLDTPTDLTDPNARWRYP